MSGGASRKLSRLAVVYISAVALRTASHLVPPTTGLGLVIVGCCFPHALEIFISQQIACRCRSNPLDSRLKGSVVFALRFLVPVTPGLLIYLYIPKHPDVPIYLGR
ncbi:hypothetical protein LZ31DRAFT_57433 [Colletotrichum somersetense]|nr:hypothetical protein LZ31DRAFT_57433 [Colletotrichum somersetense]